MTFKSALLRGVALSATVALSVGAVAHAETAHKHRKHVKAEEQKTVVAEESAATREIRALRAEVDELKARLDAQSQQQQATAAQVAQTQSQVAQVAANAASAEDKVETIPEQVNVAVGSLPKPKSDRLYVKGVAVTLGGFIAAEAVDRSNAEGADIASSFSAIPFSGAGATSSTTTAATVGHTHELRFSARQSRITGLAEGDPDADTHLAAYGELDFLGAAQTANSNESNSYNPRIRVMYATMDRKDLGISLLAGQSWSLATMTSKGITPRSELLPSVIDAQYVPGFVWARQPTFRITDHLTPEITIAASVENPQTTFSATNALPAAERVVYNESAGSNFNSANTLSLNHIPDVIAKAAWDPSFAERTFHFEVFGLMSDFYDRTATGIVINPPVAPATTSTITASATGDANTDTYGGGAGFGVVAQVIPKLVDFQVSGLAGSGIGRYGSGQLSDVSFRANGSIEPIRESIFLAGLTVHATPQLDLYGYAGQEQAERAGVSSYNGTPYGYGNGAYVNTGCFGESASGSCVGNNHTIEQATFGFWDKPYSGPFGTFRVGVQYSYTERKAFPGVGGAPTATDSMIFTSIRYYPFQ